MKFLCLILVTRMMPDHVYIYIYYLNKKRLWCQFMFVTTPLVTEHVNLNRNSPHSLKPRPPQKKDITLSSKLLGIEKC